MRLSERLRTQYPEEMTIVLQHQFWDLKVTDRASRSACRSAAFRRSSACRSTAIKSFFDPSVQFGLQFEDAGEGQDNSVAANGRTSRARRSRRPSTAAHRAGGAASRFGERAAIAAEPDAKPAKPAGGGEVVRLDRFRKK